MSTAVVDRNSRKLPLVGMCQSSHKVRSRRTILLETTDRYGFSVSVLLPTIWSLKSVLKSYGFHKFMAQIMRKKQIHTLLCSCQATYRSTRIHNEGNRSAQWRSCQFGNQWRTNRLYQKGNYELHWPLTQYWKRNCKHHWPQTNIKSSNCYKENSHNWDVLKSRSRQKTDTAKKTDVLK